MPEEMQRYLKMEKLKEQIAETQQRVADNRAECEKLMSSTREKSWSTFEGVYSIQ